MKRKIEMVLKNKGKNKYFFSNKKTGSENELFTNKVEGVNIVVSYLSNDIITRCHAIELIDEITNQQIMPITVKTTGNQLGIDIAGLAEIFLVRRGISKIFDLESKNQLPKFNVCECGEHAGFIGDDFISSQISSQEEAFYVLEEFFSAGKINKNEKAKLSGEIENSGLPLKVIDPTMN